MKNKKQKKPKVTRLIRLLSGSDTSQEYIGNVVWLTTCITFGDALSIQLKDLH